MKISFRNCHKMFHITQTMGFNFVSFFSRPKQSKFEKQKKIRFFRLTSSMFMQNFRHLVSKTKMMNEGEHFRVTFCPPW